jgi:hypothetical protein
MYIKEIESCFHRFIWKGIPDKIKRLTLIGDYEKGGGGLNMVDINSYFKSLKVSWVKRLLSSKTSNWKVIARKYLDKFGKNWLFCLSTSKFYLTVYYFFIELWDIIKIFY